MIVQIMGASHGRYFYGYSFIDMIAESVKETHPEESVKLWKKIALKELKQTGRKYYENAYPYLVKIRELLMKQNLEGEWEKFIGNLREEYKRKRTFIDIVKEL
jgi:uncharacterized Zn finger protein